MNKLYKPLHCGFNFLQQQVLRIVFFATLLLAVQYAATAQCVPPPAPIVKPNPAYLCLGNAPARLVILPTPYCSGTVNIPVPDNDPGGATSSVLVSGISCNLSSAMITINMTHPRMGDMVFALKAPNGKVINLDNRLSNTNSNTPTTGFINTVFSSAPGLPSVSTGTNPYTDTFRADLSIAAAAGPTGMVPNTALWGDLFIVPNGTWTLGFYDAASGETGTLNSWCINFVYLCNFHGYPTTQGIWTPTMGLFYDAAATVPYVGTPRDTLYVRPPVPGTYTYQVTAGSVPAGCTSPPTTVVVIVSAAPVSFVSQPADQNICLGSDATFSATTNPTAGIAYQWQESVNGGTTYTNLVNGGPYNGVNSSHLTITAPPLSMNGYRYRLLASANAQCANISSLSARLTVNPNPSITLYAHPYRKLLPGMTTTISSIVTPNAGSSFTWLLDGGIVAGATADTILVDYDHVGLYTLQVTDINGCMATSDTLRIGDSLHLRMYVYPNPSGGIFQTRLYAAPNTITPRTVILYNNMGIRVMSKAYNQTTPWQKVELDLRRNGKGIYWVEIVDKDGKRISISSVLIE